MNSKIKTAIAIIVSILTLIPHLAFASFTDITETHPYKNAIDYLEEKGVIKGYEDGTFKPNQQLSRAEFLTFALNASGNADEYETKTSPSFKDVPLNVWFYGAVETALQMGIVERKSINSDFLPTKGVTKSRALEVLFKLYGVDLLESGENETIFQDIPQKNRFSNLAKTAKKYGIFEPDTNSYFRPLKVITRGELANYIYHIETYGQKGLFEKQTKDLSKTDLDSTIFDAKEINVLIDVWNHIHKDYIDKNEINDDELLKAAIKGMVSELNDPYSSFESTDKANQFISSLNGELEGVGIEINRIENDVVIVSVIKGSPAEKAGLQAKDIIKKVDGASILNKGMSDIANMIRGAAGTTVKITVSRDGKVKDFSPVRAKIDIPEVYSEMLDGSGNVIDDEGASGTSGASGGYGAKIGLISITTFSNTLSLDFATEVRSLEEDGAQAFIIDIRNNPGGYLNAAVNVLDMIVPKNKSITTIYSGSGENVTHFSQGPGELSEKPIVVLINKGSASAAEIMAAAIKENKLGTLVGETSFGKGTVQDISYYTDGSFLKLTVAKWLTPTGQNINKTGVKPDVMVKNTSRVKDEQLEKAIEIVEKELERR